MKMDPPSYVEATRPDPTAPPPSFSAPPSYEDFLSTRELVIRHNPLDFKYGFTISNGRVDSVKPGSVAAEAGLVIGEVILALNHKVYNTQSDAEIGKQLSLLSEQKVSIRLYLKIPSTVDPSAPVISDIRSYTVEFKSGAFDAYYGIKIKGCRIQSVCPGTVGSCAGVKPGGRVVVINGVTVKGTGVKNIQRRFTSVYTEKRPLNLQVDYTCQGEEHQTEDGLPRTRRYFFALPFNPGTYGLCFHDTLIYDVQAGSTAKVVGVRAGGKVVRVNGMEVNELNSTLLQHVQHIHDMSADLLLWVEYPEEISVEPISAPVTSSQISLLFAPSPPPARRHNTSRDYRPYRVGGHTDLSWGPIDMIMNEKEAVALVFWSVISMFCFPPSGFPAVCFTVFAANSATNEKVQWHRRRAYATNILSAILGTITIIVLCVLFI